MKTNNKQQASTARLIVADSEHNADMLYATGLFVPDPFIYFESGQRTYVVLNDLEVDRAKNHATVDRVLAYSTYLGKLKKKGLTSPKFEEVLIAILKEFHIQIVEVPSSFPIGLAKSLRGIRVVVCNGRFFPEREVKTRTEINKLRSAVHLSELGMETAVRTLQNAKIDQNKYLIWQGSKLYAEDIQHLINATIAMAGGTASQTIVACGNQGCDPHETGHGPLRANQPIIIDIFPRDTSTGYWGDISRTVVRGRASDKIKKIYATVAEAQKLAFDQLHAGVDAQSVHAAVNRVFHLEGFKTRSRNGRMEGFFHGTGHGLGLEIHEFPRISQGSEILRAGNVVTIEPGLYYPGTGGVRLEDVALVQSKKAVNLTTFPKVLEI